MRLTLTDGELGDDTAVDEQIVGAGACRRTAPVPIPTLSPLGVLAAILTTFTAFWLAGRLRQEPLDRWAQMTGAASSRAEA